MRRSVRHATVGRPAAGAGPADGRWLARSRDATTLLRGWTDGDRLVLALDAEPTSPLAWWSVGVRAGIARAAVDPGGRATLGGVIPSWPGPAERQNSHLCRPFRAVSTPGRPGRWPWPCCWSSSGGAGANRGDRRTRSPMPPDRPAHGPGERRDAIARRTRPGSTPGWPPPGAAGACGSACAAWCSALGVALMTRAVLEPLVQSAVAVASTARTAGDGARTGHRARASRCRTADRSDGGDQSWTSERAPRLAGGSRTRRTRRRRAARRPRAAGAGLRRRRRRPCPVGPGPRRSRYWPQA